MPASSQVVAAEVAPFRQAQVNLAGERPVPLGLVERPLVQLNRVSDVRAHPTEPHEHAGTLVARWQLPLELTKNCRGAFPVTELLVQVREREPAPARGLDLHGRSQLQRALEQLDSVSRRSLRPQS